MADILLLYEAAGGRVRALLRWKGGREGRRQRKEGSRLGVGLGILGVAKWRGSAGGEL